MNEPSLRLRLTVWYTLALVIAVALFGADVWTVSSRPSRER